MNNERSTTRKQKNLHGEADRKIFKVKEKKKWFSDWGQNTQIEFGGATLDPRTQEGH